MNRRHLFMQLAGVFAVAVLPEPQKVSNPSRGTLIISSQEEAHFFLDLVAHAVLASPRYTSVTTTSAADLWISVSSDIEGAINGLSEVDRRVNGWTL